jgi:hypothetical protein
MSKFVVGKKKLFHAITGLLKTKAAFFPSRKQSPRNLNPMQIVRFFVACGGKVKPYQLPKP